MLSKIVSGEEEKWKVLPRAYLKVLDETYGIHNFCLRVTGCEEEPELRQIPQFYQEMIKAWQELKRAEIDAQSIQHPSEQYLWCNHNIKINNKVLTDRVWAKSGILKVKDVIGRNGDIPRDSVKSKGYTLLW